VAASLGAHAYLPEKINPRLPRHEITGHIADQPTLLPGEDAGIGKVGALEHIAIDRIHVQGRIKPYQGMQVRTVLPDGRPQRNAVKFRIDCQEYTPG